MPAGLLNTAAAVTVVAAAVGAVPAPGSRANKLLPKPRVVGGQTAVVGRYPWVVALDTVTEGDADVWSCGGTLIGDEWVLTAAHCFAPKLKAGGLKNPFGKAYLGAHKSCFSDDDSLSTNDRTGCDAKEVRDVVELHIHPNYNDRTLRNDIALARLSAKLGQTPAMIRPVPYAATAVGDDATWVDPAAVVLGWGVVDERNGGTMANELQVGSVSLVSRDKCVKDFKYSKKDILPHNLCAFNADSLEDACSGDSGGPLFHPSSGQVVGVVSWGLGKCGNKNYPGVYTEVGEFAGWIRGIAGVPALVGGGGDTLDPIPSPNPAPPPLAAEGLLFIGDSDVEGWDTATAFPGSSNKGVGGYTCRNVLNKLDRHVPTDPAPATVVIVCGENDLWNMNAVAAFRTFEKVVSKLLAMGVGQVVYMGTKPEPDTTELHQEYRQYDAKIREHASQLAVGATVVPLVMVDVYPAFLDAGNHASLYQRDGLHLSVAGYELWTEWAGAVITSDDSKCYLFQAGVCQARVDAAGPNPAPTPAPLAPVTCASYAGHCVPSRKWGLIPDAADKTCKRGKCTRRQCCQRTYAPKYCSSKKCPKWDGLEHIPNAGAILCDQKPSGKFKCSKKLCCQKRSRL